MGTVVDEFHIFFFLHHRALIVSLIYFKRPDECRHEGRSNSSLIIPWEIHHGRAEMTE